MYTYNHKILIIYSTRNNVPAITTGKTGFLTYQTHLFGRHLQNKTVRTNRRQISNNLYWIHIYIHFFLIQSQCLEL